MSKKRSFIMIYWCQYLDDLSQYCDIKPKLMVLILQNNSACNGLTWNFFESHGHPAWATLMISTADNTSNSSEYLKSWSLAISRACSMKSTVLTGWLKRTKQNKNPLAHLGLIRVLLVSPGAVRFVTQICITREMRAVFRDINMWYQAKMSYKENITTMLDNAWTNFDLSSNVFCGIHLQFHTEVLMNLIYDIFL